MNTREKKLAWHRKSGFAIATLILAMTVLSIGTLQTGQIDTMLPGSVGTLCMEVLALLMLVGMSSSVARSHGNGLVRGLFMLLLLCSATYLFLDIICNVLNHLTGHRLLNNIVNRLYYMNSIGVCWLFWRFVRAWGGDESEEHSLGNSIVNTFAVLGLVLIFIDCFVHIYFTVDEMGRYARTDTYFISLICPMILLTVCSVNILCKQIPWQDKAILLSHPLLSLLCIVLNLGFGGPQLLGLGAFVSAFFIYSNLYVRRDQEYAKQQNQRARHDTELRETGVRLIATQLQKQSVSEALDKVRDLYQRSPQGAGLVLDHYLSSLQISLTDLAAFEPVMASRELVGVRQLVELERLTRPDLTVEISVQNDQFLLPALTIQPLVHNAIHHGLANVPSGVIVRVSLLADQRNYLVIVADNGVGFDPSKIQPNSTVDTIRTRLQAMCNGTLEYESTVGRGTVATVRIPKKTE